MSNLPWAWISNSIFIIPTKLERLWLCMQTDCAWWCTVHAKLNLNRQTDILRKWHYEHVRLTRECSNYSNSNTANCRQQKGGCQGNLIACALSIFQCQKHTTRLVRVVNSNSSIWSNYQSCMLHTQLFVRFRMPGSRGKERFTEFNQQTCWSLQQLKA